MNDCIFCKIIKGEIPCYKIYEDDNVLAFLDIAGDCYGHTLVVPKKHCTNLLDCNGETFAQVMLAVQKISQHFVDDCGFEGVNILNASGKCAEQSVFHLHIHIIPRKNGDGLKAWPFSETHSFDMAEICGKLAIK